MNKIEKDLVNLGFEILNNENYVTRYYDFSYGGRICFTFVEKTNCFYSHLADNINYYHTDMRDNTKYRNILIMAKKIVKTVKMVKIRELKDAFSVDFE
jgi:hypothetical protein